MKDVFLKKLKKGRVIWKIMMDQIIAMFQFRCLSHLEFLFSLCNLSRMEYLGVSGLIKETVKPVVLVVSYLAKEGKRDLYLHVYLIVEKEEESPIRLRRSLSLFSSIQKLVWWPVESLMSPDVCHTTLNRIT